MKGRRVSSLPLSFLRFARSPAPGARPPRKGAATGLACALVVVALAAPGLASAPVAADPPFDAAGIGAAKVGEVWSSRADPDRRFESSEFEVPDVLTLVIAGYPGRDGIVLALEDRVDGARLTLAPPEAGYAWHPVRFAIPDEWIGRRARVIASAEGSASWIGVTSPVRLAHSSLSHLALPLLVLECFALFLLPGLAILGLAGRRFEPWARIGLVITGSCLAGYAAFYLYFFSPLLGIVTSAVVLVLSALVVASRLRRIDGRQLLGARELLSPLALMLLYSMFAACLTFVRTPSWTEADEIPRNRYVRALPGDNALPQYFAERLWNGADARELIGGWLSSDRPPLQTGLLLLQRPVADATGTAPSLFAQVAGMVFQSSWIAGIWIVCAAARLRRAALAIALAGAGLSGFFLLNTAFVWPKMLAAALGLIAIALLVASSRDGWSRRQTVLAATSACLAILAHSGAVFAIAPAALVFASGRRRPGVRDIAAAVAIAVTLFVPWMLYQRLYAPPGNRLVMLHVAGAEEETALSFTEALVGNYRRVGIENALRARWENVRLLVPFLDTARFSSAESRREVEWNRVFGTLGALNLGWLMLLRRVTKRERAPAEVRRLYWTAGAGLAFGIVVLFSPGVATAHVASFTAIALLFVLASQELSILPRAATLAVVAAQAAIFVIDWIVLTPPRSPASALPIVSPPLAVTAVLAGAGFLAASMIVGMLDEPASRETPSADAAHS
ncbi:MAG: hypothetical protein ACSLFQ_20130 [Thermoanaerobaculia bacterium]